MGFNKDVDVIRSIRLLDWLKCEMLNDIAKLFNEMSLSGKEGKTEDFSESLSNIILISYLLGRRLGVDFKQIERKLSNKIRLGLLEGHEVEKSFGDLSELSKYFKKEM